MAEYVFIHAKCAYFISGIIGPDHAISYFMPNPFFWVRTVFRFLCRAVPSTIPCNYECNAKDDEKFIHACWLQDTRAGTRFTCCVTFNRISTWLHHISLNFDSMFEVFFCSGCNAHGYLSIFIGWIWRQRLSRYHWTEIGPWITSPLGGKLLTALFSVADVLFLSGRLKCVAFENLLDLNPDGAILSFFRTSSKLSLVVEVIFVAQKNS